MQLLNMPGRGTKTTATLARIVTMLCVGSEARLRIVFASEKAKTNFILRLREFNIQVSDCGNLVLEVIKPV